MTTVAARDVNTGDKYADQNATLAPSPDWPCCPEGGQMACTSERPRPKDAPGRWFHPEAILAYEGDYSSSYKCPACGLYFSVEGPDY